MWHWLTELHIYNDQRQGEVSTTRVDLPDLHETVHVAPRLNMPKTISKLTAYNTQLSGVTRKEAFATKWRSHSQTEPGVARPSDR